MMEEKYGRSEMFQTEYEFTLPKGYVDKAGNLHQKGIMRLATAADEIIPLRDPRVQQNPGYLTILLLSRVIIRLGELSQVTPEVIERLFSVDLNFLQNMYQTINELEEPVIHVTCPHCGKEFTETINFKR